MVLDGRISTFRDGGKVSLRSEETWGGDKCLVHLTPEQAFELAHKLTELAKDIVIRVGE